MKVTVKEKSETKEYPWIGISEVDKCVVLFFHKNIGVCLDSGDTLNCVGEYTDNWNERGFDRFEGEIVLSNS